MALTSLGLAGIGAGVQALTGIGQMLLAGPRMAPPKFNVSPFEKQGLDIARQLSTQGIPEATKQFYKQQAMQNAIFASRNMANLSRGGALAGQGNIQAGLDRSMLNLAMQDATARQQNIRNFETALYRRAQTDYRAFQNEAQQYANEEMRRASMFGAGIANVGRAGGMFGQAAMMSLYGRDKEDKKIA
jgi:hypothetical protein